MEQTKTAVILSGSKTEPTDMGVSSVGSGTLLAPAKKRTTRRRRRGSKVNPQMQLEIVQSALAKLGEVMEVYAKAEYTFDADYSNTANPIVRVDRIVITIVGATIADKKFVPTKGH